MTPAHQPTSAQQGEVSVIPRHEYPGRMVGLIKSGLCVVGLIVLLLG